MSDTNDFEPGFRRPKVGVANEPDYQCAAKGCPLRATITDATAHEFRGGRCRYHDAMPPHGWPALTQLLRSTPFTRAALEGSLAVLGIRWREDQPLPPPATKPPGMTSEHWAAHHLSLIRCIKAEPDTDKRAWARKLRDREQAGEPLHPIQANAWREALGTAPLTAAEQEALEERLAIQAAG